MHGGRLLLRRLGAGRPVSRATAVFTYPPPNRTAGYTKSKGVAVVDNELLLILARLQDLYAERIVKLPWEPPPSSMETRASGTRVAVPGSSLRNVIELYCGSFSPPGDSAWASLDEATIRRPFFLELSNLNTDRSEIELLVDALNVARADFEVSELDAEGEGEEGGSAVISPLSADILRKTWTTDLYTTGKRLTTRLNDPATWAAMLPYLSKHHALPQLLRAARDVAVEKQKARVQQEKLVAPLNPEPSSLRAMADARLLEASLILDSSTWRSPPRRCITVAV